MARESAIEWTDATFNPWIGCAKVSPACDHCYAEVSAPARTNGIPWGPNAPRYRTKPANWNEPRRWNARAFWECLECSWRGEAKDDNGLAFCPRCDCVTPLKAARRRVFSASLADVFDNAVDPAWRADLFALIEATPNLDWLLLTKRVGNVKRMAPAPWIGGPVQHGPDPTNIHGGWPRHVWIGATVCNQEEADRDARKLCELPAPVRFLSIEPMLGPIDLRLAFFGHCPTHDFPGGFCVQRRHAGVRHIDWVIVGGESGRNARPMHPDWPRAIRDQCVAAGVPFLFKQWGEHSLEYDRDRDDPDWRRCAEWDRKPGRWINLAGGHGFHGERVHYAHRVGKKAAGRTLDGALHNGYPTPGEAAP